MSYASAQLTLTAVSELGTGVFSTDKGVTTKRLAWCHTHSGRAGAGTSICLQTLLSSPFGIHSSWPSDDFCPAWLSLVTGISWHFYYCRVFFRPSPGCFQSAIKIVYKGAASLIFSWKEGRAIFHSCLIPNLPSCSPSKPLGQSHTRLHRRLKASPHFAFPESLWQKQLLQEVLCTRHCDRKTNCWALNWRKTEGNLSAVFQLCSSTFFEFELWWWFPFILKVKLLGGGFSGNVLLKH